MIQITNGVFADIASIFAENSDYIESITSIGTTLTMMKFVSLEHDFLWKLWHLDLEIRVIAIKFSNS